LFGLRVDVSRIEVEPTPYGLHWAMIIMILPTMPVQTGARLDRRLRTGEGSENGAVRQLPLTVQR
jgi:hypothetical protein